jgi:hypothetical protein
VIIEAHVRSRREIAIAIIERQKIGGAGARRLHKKAGKGARVRSKVERKRECGRRGDAVLLLVAYIRERDAG